MQRKHFYYELKTILKYLFLINICKNSKLWIDWCPHIEPQKLNNEPCQYADFDYTFGAEQQLKINRYKITFYITEPGEYTLSDISRERSGGCYGNAILEQLFLK